jgi:N-acetyl-anhydromuramyl-L-alanine amidase AmpD/V8-like Glu-specific endopeptidase
MATQIRPNRLEVSDRFPMLGFTIRTDGPAKRYELAIGASPDLFGPEGKSNRTRGNFYSTRAAGPLSIERGEAVYVLPAEILARFVGQRKLYYGLATYSNGAVSGAEVINMPSTGSPYINLAGLTGRSLQRVRLLPSRQRSNSGYGKNGSDMDWAGDAAVPGTQPATPPASNGDTPKVSTAPSAPVHYDDGYGPLPAAPAPATTEPKREAASPALSPQAKSLANDGQPADEDAQHGIEGPIPDAGASTQSLAQPLEISSEYPQASRFEPANSGNYRAVTGARTINRIVIHITDGQPNINGTISWFKNPSARVSAHYIVGQDGEVVQMVKNNDLAWHASSANSDSIGIEHVARSPHEWDKKLGHADPGMMPTEKQYCGSAALVNWLCNQFQIPIDRAHVLGHSEADPHTTHTDCPNAVWDWDYYMGLVAVGSCAPDTASASSLSATSSARTAGQRNGQAKPQAKAMRQVDPGYSPGNSQDALQYMKDFQDRKQAWKAGVPDTTFFPHSAICRFRIFKPDGEYIGTGFYIGNDRILTCAHNVVNATDITVIPGKNDSAEPFGAFPARASDWLIHPKYDPSVADSTDSGHDFDLAVIKVTIPPPNGLYFPILEELLQCQESPIIVCGYAADTVNADKQHLDGDAIRALSDSDGTFLYNLQTEPGNSGSPVYYVTSRDDEEQQMCVLETRVVGVHVASDSKIFNRGCRLTADKIAWIRSIGKAVSAGAQAYAPAQKKPSSRGVLAQAAADDKDDQRGIEGPIPDDTSAAQALARPLALSPEYPQASRFEPADSGNFHAIAGTRTINRIVIHITDGGANINGTVSWFKNPSAKVSAHYVVGQDGEVVQMVKHNDVAWHASRANGDSIGIEHVANTRGLNPTPAQYCASATLVNWLATQFGLPMDRTHILGHSEADPTTTHRACPNAVWDWDYYMGMVTSASCYEPATAGQSLGVVLPPPPKRAKSRAMDVTSSRLIANSPVTTVAGAEGNVTWELDQFPGVKTTTQAAAVPLLSAETIHLANWPYCEYPDGSRSSAWFTVDWKFSGQALGQIRITPSGTQQGSQPLRVEARIEDSKDRGGNTASLKARFTYRFSMPDGSGAVALTDLTLYSDGSLDQTSNWTARAAA